MNSKVTFLFHAKEMICPTDERMILFLDEPDTQADKRAFLYHITACDSCRQKWNQLDRILQAGSALPVLEPDPAIRAQVLNFAYQESHRKTGYIHPTETRTDLRLPGWRLAWAALFLVISWGVLEQFTKTPISSVKLEQVDYELLTLEQDMEQLQSELIDSSAGEQV